MSRAPWLLLLSVLLAWGALRLWLPAAPVDFEQAEAFGAQTTSRFARAGQWPIHCRDARDAAQCVAGARARGAGDAIVWFGNSQLHAINQYRDGDGTAVQRLFPVAAAAGRDLTAYSQPSASFQEQLVMLAWLLPRLPVRTLVLPAVYDDTREDGVRDTLRPLLEDADAAALLRGTASGARLLQAKRPEGAGDDARDAGVAGAAGDGRDDSALAGSVQQRIERPLDDWLARHSALWAARATMRGQLANALYVARNTVFGIHSTSPRRRIVGRYAANLQALQDMLQLCAAHGVRVQLYIAPIRDDVPLPYERADYAAFKSDVQRLALSHGAQFADLEALVPAALWGVKAAGIAGQGATEVDFMHFRADGHRLLAARVAELIGLGAVAP